MKWIIFILTWLLGEYTPVPKPKETEVISGYSLIKGLLSRALKSNYQSDNGEFIGVLIKKAEEKRQRKQAKNKAVKL